MKEQKIYGIILLLLTFLGWRLIGETSALVGILGLYLLFARRCLIYKGGEDHDREQ